MDLSCYGYRFQLSASHEKAARLNLRIVLFHWTTLVLTCLWLIDCHWCVNVAIQVHMQSIAAQAGPTSTDTVTLPVE